MVRAAWRSSGRVRRRAKDEGGDVLITLVEGRDESHKVKYGRVDRSSRLLIRFEPKARHVQSGHADGAARL